MHTHPFESITLLPSMTREVGARRLSAASGSCRDTDAGAGRRCPLPDRETEEGADLESLSDGLLSKAEPGPDQARYNRQRRAFGPTGSARSLAEVGGDRLGGHGIVLINNWPPRVATTS